MTISVAESSAKPRHAHGDSSRHRAGHRGRAVRRVFEPFGQEPHGTTRHLDGTGLSLAISRDLARGMGGELSADSVPGAGSTFTLELPRAAPEPRATRADSSQSRRPPRNSEPVQPAASS